ncbi:hypothetical protein ABZX85_24410 [Streptomyces sp. NPDC004539]|uniref:DUF7639 domain-containing protein n=1 Tax=Streptomyces sp. NPDC004539 TaxID=3154280 RepID=UPI0033B8962D
MYADGVVHCEELTELGGLERWLKGGRLALAEPGVPVRTPPAGRAWRWGEPRTVESFLLEVADLVEELAGRTTARQRCSEAIREAYLRILAHLRIYCLGDMDRPLRILFAGVGASVGGFVVTAGIWEAGGEVDSGIG